MPTLIHDVVRQTCDRLKYRWRERERELDPVTTIHLFLTQILHGNTSCRGLRRVSNLDASAVEPNRVCRSDGSRSPR
jgi:transposase